MIRVVIAVVLVTLVGAAFYLVVRPGQEVASGSNPGVTIACDGSTGVGADECRSWGDAVLALGAPSSTFEFEDVDRLRFSRPLFGFGSPCQVAYYLERYSDDPAWEDDVSCAGE
ncbi:MAG TPA: hypothetical protein VFW95_03250 [Candidatus Limnocylindria bacterium]|nr:hypothetical protein [Candidatus Limnocylindria bacterium]